MILAVAVRTLHAAPLRPRPSPRLRRTSSSVAPVVASAKRLRRRRRPLSIGDDAGKPVEEATREVSSAEVEFLAALESEPAPLERNGEATSSRPTQPVLSSSSGGVEGAPLRGLDVLQALQHKAAARRKAGAGGGKGDRGQRRGARGGGGGGERHLDARDYSNVRPLDINSEWGARLDELDRLVQDLQAQQHLYSDSCG